MSTSERLGAPTRHDVVVVGDGPAGSALAAALTDADVDVLLIGEDLPWDATYGTWVDEVPTTLTVDGSADVFATRTAVDVVGARRHELTREYAVFDNERLRAASRRAPHRIGRVVSVDQTKDGARVVTDGREVVLARLVVDATGALSGLVATRRGGRQGGRREHGATSWQTAYGLVLDEPPAAVEGDRALLMDWRSPGIAFEDEPTFLYSVPLGDRRWLVEETSLARREPMSASHLRLRLAARLGGDMTDRALGVEHVAIPMRSGIPDRHHFVVGFGASARYLHPATGYSVTASLRAAPRVAEEIAAALRDGEPADELARRAWNAVWPAPARRSRALHDRGLNALLRMRTDDIRVFFDAFFDLPVADWSEYLRIDGGPLAVSRSMANVFSSVPWSLRRRLAMGSPSALRRSLLARARLRTSSPTAAQPAPSRPGRTR